MVDRRTWRHYDRVFCISKGVRQRLITHRLVDPSRIEVVYPGVDFVRFAPSGSVGAVLLVAGPDHVAEADRARARRMAIVQAAPRRQPVRTRDQRHGRREEPRLPRVVAQVGRVAGRRAVRHNTVRRRAPLRSIRAATRCCSPRRTRTSVSYRSKRWRAARRSSPPPAVARPRPSSIGHTGFLVPSEARAFAATMHHIVDMEDDDRRHMERKARGAGDGVRVVPFRRPARRSLRRVGAVADPVARARAQQGVVTALRVGIDAWGIGGSGLATGMGQYTGALVKWLPTVGDIDVVAYGAPGEPRPEWLPGAVEWRAPGTARAGKARRDPVPPRHDGARGRGRRHRRVPQPGGARSAVVPAGRRACTAALVVTIHDVIPLSYYGAALPPRVRAFYRWNLRRAAGADRRLDGVRTRASGDRRAHRHRGVARSTWSSSAIEFAPLRDQNALLRNGATRPYLLFAGSYEPRKNLAGTLRAFDEYVAAGRRADLVAVTEATSGHAPAPHTRCSTRWSRPRSGAPGARRAASTTCARCTPPREAVVFPSFAEGLGLPPLQAAACGVPVVVSDLPVFAETVGDDRGRGRRGQRLRPLAAAMRARRDRSRDPGRAPRAADPRSRPRFAPRRCAESHAAIYRSCLRERQTRCDASDGARAHDRAAAGRRRGSAAPGRGGRVLVVVDHVPARTRPTTVPGPPPSAAVVRSIVAAGRGRPARRYVLLLLVRRRDQAAPAPAGRAADAPARRNRRRRGTRPPGSNASCSTWTTPASTSRCRCSGA